MSLNYKCQNVKGKYFEIIFWVYMMIYDMNVKFLNLINRPYWIICSPFIETSFSNYLNYYLQFHSVYYKIIQMNGIYFLIILICKNYFYVIIYASSQLHLNFQKEMKHIFRILQFIRKLIFQLLWNTFSV